MGSKKLLVISDTHGSAKPLLSVLKWAKERTPPNDTICAAVFLGDGVDDLQFAIDATGFACNWAVVKGNNDYYIQEAESTAFDFVNYRFFITHGHRFFSGSNALVSAARANGANVVLSGHTHVPHRKLVDGIHLINPGSVSRPRSRTGATFAVIECEEGKELKVEFYNIDGNGEIRVIKV